MDVDWQRVRAVVFDVDGTLYDAPPVRRRMALELLAYCARHPRQLPLISLLQTFRRQREKLAAQEAEHVSSLQYRLPAAALGIPEEAVREAVGTWILERPLRHVARHRAAHVEVTFAALRRRGLRLAALSDYPTAAKLAVLGLEVDVEVAATDPEVDRFKPHPAGLERALELLSCTPGEGLVIGDRDDRDGEAARRAGVPFFARGRASGPRVFAAYAEILAALPD